MNFKIELLHDYIKNDNSEAIIFLMKEYNLEIDDGVIKAKEKEIAIKTSNFWEQRQLSRKILLNSLNA